MKGIITTLLEHDIPLGSIALEVRYSSSLFPFPFLQSLTVMYSLLLLLFLIPKEHSERIQAVSKEVEFDHLPMDLLESINALLKDSGVQSVLRNTKKHKLDPNAAYFFENIERIISPVFTPSLKDIFLASEHRNSVSELKFLERHTCYKLVSPSFLFSPFFSTFIS